MGKSSTTRLQGVAKETVAKSAPSEAPVSETPAVDMAAQQSGTASLPAVGNTDLRQDDKGKKGSKKPKLIRDSFTFPEADYARIADLKQRIMKTGREVKKSELLRAGLAALSALSDSDLIKTLDGIDRLKLGRPPR